MKRLGLILGLVCVAAQAYAAGAPVRIDEGDTVTGQLDIVVSTGSPTLVRASNSLRAVLSCTTTETVRWGPISLTDTTGQRVPADASIQIRNTGAVYMIAEGADATVSCTEESYSNSSGSTFSP